MISDEPRHGYELMKAVEDRMGGSYIPSPGVTYPTLSWLEDMGYASAETDQAGRKRYQITPQGKAFLAANQVAIDELLSRIRKGGAGRFGGVPAPILRGMENLKLAPTVAAIDRLLHLRPLPPQRHHERRLAS
jgi:DNA-binding PadR family transcriptional regulator